MILQRGNACAALGCRGVGDATAVSSWGLPSMSGVGIMVPLTVCDLPLDPSLLDVALGFASSERHSEPEVGTLPLSSPRSVAPASPRGVMTSRAFSRSATSLLGDSTLPPSSDGSSVLYPKFSSAESFDQHFGFHFSFSFRIEFPLPCSSCSSICSHCAPLRLARIGASSFR